MTLEMLRQQVVTQGRRGAAASRSARPPLNFTHKQLVNLARKWLARRCAVVVTELACNAEEEADALGWRADGHTTAVECKTSLSDFRADAKKFFRQHPEMGMGAERYYLTAAGLIDPSCVPGGWGLLTWDGRRFRTARESVYFECRSHAREQRTLISLLRRMRRPDSDGVMVRCYTIEAAGKRPRATLGIAPLPAGVKSSVPAAQAAPIDV